MSNDEIDPLLEAYDQACRLQMTTYQALRNAESTLSKAAQADTDARALFDWLAEMMRVSMREHWEVWFFDASADDNRGLSELEANYRSLEKATAHIDRENALLLNQ